MADTNDAIRLDSRFEQIKNRNIRHWKVNLNSIEDFKTNTDLILEAYQSIKISEESLSKVTPELCEISETMYLSRKNIGKSILETISDYTVIDLETTSKYINWAEVIELAAVKIRSGKITETFSQLVKPSKHITKEITDLTGITNEMLTNAPIIQEVFRKYIDFIGDDIILGHNIVCYDSKILCNVCEALGYNPIQNTMLDTLRYSRYCNIDVPNHKLKTISEYFGIKYQAHRALNDCIANFEVYEKLKEHFTGRYVFHGETHRKISEKPLKITGVNPEYSDLKEKNIVLTGKFAAGQRKLVKLYLANLGAVIKSRVSGKTDYLIIGSLGSPDWKFGNYGDKVDKAQILQKAGKAIEIVQEGEFFECTQA